MLTIFVYLLSFFLGPIIGGLVVLIFMPLVLSLLSLSKSKLLSGTVGVIIGTVIGGISFWFATTVFVWFNLQPTVFLAIILALGFAFNDFKRVDRAPKEVAHFEISSGIGDLLGIIIGAIYFL
jgi:hypothetical protein